MSRYEPRQGEWGESEAHPVKPPTDLTNDALNAAIAREVMGWTEWETYAAFCAGPFPAFYVQADGIIHVWYGGDAGDVYAWSPATDIAAAFEVVERMREACDFECCLLRDRWLAQFWLRKQASKNAMWLGNGRDTLPRAICEAALAAVRNEVTMSEENMDRARALIPYEVPSRDADIRAIATALDAAEQRGAEREREACADLCDAQQFLYNRPDDRSLAIQDALTRIAAAIRARSNP